MTSLQLEFWQNSLLGQVEFLYWVCLFLQISARSVAVETTDCLPYFDLHLTVLMQEWLASVSFFVWLVMWSLTHKLSWLFGAVERLMQFAQDLILILVGTYLVLWIVLVEDSHAVTSFEPVVLVGCGTYDVIRIVEIGRVWQYGSTFPLPEHSWTFVLDLVPGLARAEACYLHWLLYPQLPRLYELWKKSWAVWLIMCVRW